MTIMYSDVVNTLMLIISIIALVIQVKQNKD